MYFTHQWQLSVLQVNTFWIPSWLLPTQLPHHCKKGKFVMDPLDTDWMTTIILTLSGGRSDSFTTKAPCWSTEHGVNLPSEKKAWINFVCICKEYMYASTISYLLFFSLFFSFLFVCVCVHLSIYVICLGVYKEKRKKSETRMTASILKWDSNT